MGHHVVWTGKSGGYINFKLDDGTAWMVLDGMTVSCPQLRLEVTAVSHTQISVRNLEDSKVYMVPVPWDKGTPVTTIESPEDLKNALTHGPHPDKVILDDPVPEPARCDIVVENSAGDNGIMVQPGRVWINDTEVTGVYRIETRTKPNDPVEVQLIVYPTSITFGNPYIPEEEGVLLQNKRLNMGAMKRGRKPKRLPKSSLPAVEAEEQPGPEQ